MATDADLTPHAIATGERPARWRLPGIATYLVLASWVGGIALAIVSGGFAGEGMARLALPAAWSLPVAVMVISYRTSRRFRTYLLALDPRLVLGAQLWRVVGISFLVAWAFGELPAGFAVPAGLGDIATGIAALGVLIALGNGDLGRGRLYAFTSLGLVDFAVAFIAGLWLAPAALDTWPLAIFPTVMVPFFTVLHVVAVLQFRNARLGRSRLLASSS